MGTKFKQKYEHYLNEKANRFADVQEVKEETASIKINVNFAFFYA